MSAAYQHVRRFCKLTAIRMQPFIILALFAALSLVACSESPSRSPSPETATANTAVQSTQTPFVTVPASRAAPSPTTPLLPTVAETPAIQPVIPTPPTTPTPAPCPMDVAALPALSSPSAPLDIVYLSEGNIWLWTEASETAAPLAILDRIINVRLSGDAQQVAFVRQVGEAEELWVIGRDGTGEKLLMDADAFRQLAVEPLATAIVTEQLDWVPGAHLLAFNTRPILPGLPQRHYDDFRLIDVDNGNRPFWLPAGAGGSFNFSPDGDQITLWQPGQISLATTAEQAAPSRVISYTTDIESSHPPQPVWADDAQSFRVALPGEMGVFSIWHMPLAEGPPVILDEVLGLPNSAAISPNLAWLAYLRPGPDEFETRELHIAAPDGSWDIIYDSGPALEFLGWSPDGLRFAYRTSQDAIIGELCAPAVPFQPAHALDLPLLIWADDERFVYAVGRPGVGEGGVWQLRLGALDGTSDLLAEMQAGQPVFDLSHHR